MAQQKRPNMQQMVKQVQQMQREMEQAQEALKHETVEASAGGGVVRVKVSGDLQVKAVTIAPEAADPEDVEMLGDMVLAAVNEALRAAQELAAERHGRSDRGPRSGRARRSRPARPVRGSDGDTETRCEHLRAPRPAAGHRALEAARNRQPHGAAPRLPHPARLRGGRHGARAVDPRCEGADRAVRGVLQPRRRAALSHLPRSPPRPRA